MTTTVTFEIAKLLKEKGFDKNTLQWYHRETKKLKTNDLMFSMNKLTDNYSAPTIAEVIMWLYEKHGIWINARRHMNKFICEKNNIAVTYDDKEFYFNTPVDAYLSAIDNALKNI